MGSDKLEAVLEQAMHGCQSLKEHVARLLRSETTPVATCIYWVK